MNNKLLEQLIQKNSGYYLNVFQKFEQTGGKISFNLSGFIFSFIWLFYRKMYTQAIIHCVIFIVGCIFDMGLIASISVGFFGNYMYYSHLNGHVENIKSLSRNTKSEVINQVGGTVW
ncbi:MAG: hypothetical protein ATN36_01050 [Epulopiscium sp. Nele67-Bin005]|nr:MAG: hypothetical protein ATN36_01050 [Epulopiscium sp. Nele67-Bin005]